MSAALTGNGVPRQAILTARARGIIALSLPVYTEIAEVLGRPKFAKLIDDDRRRESLAIDE